MSGFLMCIVLREDIDVCEYNDLRRYQDVNYDLFLYYRMAKASKNSENGINSWTAKCPSLIDNF